MFKFSKNKNLDQCTEYTHWAQRSIFASNAKYYTVLTFCKNDEHIQPIFLRATEILKIQNREVLKNILKILIHILNW